MSNDLLTIDPQKEKDRIITFLKDTFESQHISKAVIGVSGGIDSAVSFALLKEACKPEDILVAHLYYFESKFGEMEKFVTDCQIPQKNIYHISIKKAVDIIVELQHIEEDELKNVRIGNIAARVRMIVLYDLAKKTNALVCGTENKSENLLGYFTRFGDQASDIEPIEHLYKTQIVAMAKFLHIPETIITQAPSAGLWVGQTDEGQFGFSYEEADQVLFLHLEKNVSVEEIESEGYPNAKKIIDWHTSYLFKHQTPYTIK
ncbi:MAG TPA: NAD(+) synthase [Candidatus Saccharimonadales bacterium]|nr:NAD(+) synthase [Candidatus Saccharimonadales bacterium]